MRRFTEIRGHESGLLGATAWNALSFSPAMQMRRHEPHSIIPAELHTLSTSQTVQEGAGLYRLACEHGQQHRQVGRDCAHDIRSAKTVEPG